MNSSIKSKLIGGFAIVILLLIGLGILVSDKIAEANERLDNIVNVSAYKVSLSKDVLISMLDIARNEKNVIIESDQASRQVFVDKLKFAIDRIDHQIPALHQLTDSLGRIIIGDLPQSWQTYKTNLDKIIFWSNNNNSDSAFELSINKGLTFRENTINKLNTLVSKNQADMVNEKELNDRSYNSAINMIIFFIIICLVTSLMLAYWIVFGITRRISYISKEAERIASREFSKQRSLIMGKDELRPIINALLNINESFREITESANIVASGNYDNDFKPRSENDSLGVALRKMTVSLRETTEVNQKHSWLANGQNQLNEKLRGDLAIEQLSTDVISFISLYLNANIGALYIRGDDNLMMLVGKFAFSENGSARKYAMGEGLIGQVARQQKVIAISDLENEDVQIVSTFLNTKPRSLLIVPFIFEGRTLGVIEVGRFTQFTELELEFLQVSSESIAVSVNSAVSRMKIKQLLEETQAQSEELQSQQEELKQMNEELEGHAQSLKQQQEELKMTNEELEEQTQALEFKNSVIEAAKEDIEQKTKQLEVSSRYKSEFLANMSHELRTPLNSLLILSEDLAENRSSNLTEEQIESAEIINKSGQDLLVLINDVLDLSKIESGKMDINIEKVSLKDFTGELQRDFKHQAEKKGLVFCINVDKNLSGIIHTDSQRLKQILKNLISNALKFTEKGKIEVNFDKVAFNKVAISVSDSGIGIHEDKHLSVFEAFQQADGGTSRKYGGTGLGLSISRELAKILQGQITLHSIPNEGSTFTLTIPINFDEQLVKPVQQLESNSKTQVKITRSFDAAQFPSIEDDRQSINQGDKVVLVIEDDINLAEVLKRQANGKGFKCIACSTGEEGLAIARKFSPNAILLDLELPGIHGQHVLAELKATPSLRHIPVHIISGSERSLDTIRDGAIEYLTKPINKRQLEEAFSRIENFIDRKMKNLLIIEDDENSRKAIRRLIGNGDVECLEAGSGNDALRIYKENHIDCIVLDLKLPDINGFDLIKEMGTVKIKLPPVIIYTGKELTKEENNELQKFAESIIIKGAKSEERLLDETALFLHRTIKNLPDNKKRIIENLYDKDIIFRDKKILLVDDDMRNLFALTKILKERGMEIVKAENGVLALDALKKNPDTKLVLMDIMMPEMDGYEAMRSIRDESRFASLPIIALTAKAMKDDRQKCIVAGANDYITKPVDIDRLLTLMRVWLSK
jgi:CheY-like chemotaxis protein/methyl-accepting chemotaxis protein